jgi:hypothetical protein
MKATIFSDKMKAINEGRFIHRSDFIATLHKDLEEPYRGIILAKLAMMSRRTYYRTHVYQLAQDMNTTPEIANKIISLSGIL